MGQEDHVDHRAPGATRSGLRAIAVIALGTFGVQAMILVTGIISARLLGVEGRGQVALVAAVSVLFARLTMAGSLPVAISQLLSRERLAARDGLRPYVGSWARWAVVPSALAGGYLAWLLRDESTYLQVGLAVAVTLITYETIAAGLVGSSVQGELAGAGTVVRGALQLQAPTFLLLLAAALLGQVDDAVTVTALMVLGGLLGCLWAARLLQPAHGVPSTITGAELRRVTADNYLNSVGVLSGLGIDRNLVGAWMGTAALGLYAAGTAFATLSTVLGNAVASLLLPRLSAESDDPAAQARLIRAWLPLTGALIVVLVGTLELLVEPVIRIAFGAEFLPAVAVARWLLLADGLLGFRRVLVCILQARGRGRIASVIEVALTVLMVGGIGFAALRDDLTLVGITLAGVGALSCLLLAVAIRATRPA
jgi:O-antigen/teichoic acid export membrane protein